VDSGPSGRRLGLAAPPAFGRRRLVRAAIVGLIAAALVGGGGLLVEHLLVGSSDADTLGHVAAEVQQDFTTLATELEDATQHVASNRDARTPSGPDTARARALFDITAALVGTHGHIDAVSVYEPGGRPVAWAGRPSTLPDERVLGPEALFVAPGPAGVRLVHVRPIAESGPSGRRLGSVAAEHLLTRDSVARAGNPTAFTFETSLVPVSLRPRYEGAGDATPPYGFLLTAPGGAPLLEAEVAPGALEGLRRSWQMRLVDLMLALVAIVGLVVATIIREAQEVSQSRRRFLALTAALVSVLVVTRLVLALATPADWLTGVTGPLVERALLRSPLDFLATALLLLALVAIAGDIVERWRVARHARARNAVGSALRTLAFWAGQLVTASAIGGCLVLHEHLLSAIVRDSGTVGLRFSLHPFDLSRLTLLVGTVCLNAAAFWAMVMLARFAASWWRVRRQALAVRAGLGLVYVVVPLTVHAALGSWRVLPESLPLVPSVVAVVACAAMARWVAPRYRHASQALRLLVAYLALTLPSLALYPAIVALEDVALSNTIAHQYTPEVLNHRNELRVVLRRSLDDLDAVAGLADQFPSDLTPAGRPDTDRAYFLWSQTELGRQRLTSSVDLYTADGNVVSRFALNLPAEFLVGDRPADASCSWVVYGEAPPSTDDHVLLHAGRAVCTTDAAGVQHRVGVLLVHVVLDYGTLPFVAAQDPYAELFRPTLEAAAQTHGREIAFAVYGWGRTPVYPTAGTAWPISRELLQRLFRADREAFWTLLERGDQTYRVLLSNDRAGIYAIGYAIPRPVDHAVALAEIGTLAAVTFALLLVVVGLVGRLAGRHPVTGRALLREIRQSFYRKLFLLFVASSVVPVLALAFVTRAYVAGQLREGLEAGALRTASAARRVIETVVSQQRRDRSDPSVLSDDIMISVSRIIDQDVNVFVNPRLVATSQRDLFASGLLPTRTPAEVARAITLERQASYVGDERLGRLQYTVAAVPVRDGETGAILTVPLTLRQQEIEREIDALDRRVTLAAVLFILLGAGIGYVTAERIADPVNRLTRATGRIARGDLDARIHASTADELRRLVDAFNQMADDLKRQRAELERTNRLAAWADMARQVAHDIKNPLTPIQLSAEHLRRVHQDAGRPLGRVLDGCVDTILSQVSLLRQISSEFSSFASSPVARPAPTRVSDVVDEVVAPYRSGLPDNVRLVVDHADVLPEQPLDRGLLGRGLVNVIENGLHAMRGGGTLTIRTSPDDGGTLLVVEDTGVGMDADALAHLFEPYFSTKATGTGLGLTIAKRNVELNGGTITVESEKGRGTRVTIRLPAPPAASA
jgi:signal transduction histidine kinase